MNLCLLCLDGGPAFHEISLLLSLFFLNLRMYSTYCSSNKKRGKPKSKMMLLYARPIVSVFVLSPFSTLYQNFPFVHSYTHVCSVRTRGTSKCALSINAGLDRKRLKDCKRHVPCFGIALDCFRRPPDKKAYIL